MAFNKMFVMVPLMLAARKINGEDPNIVFMLRVAYAVVQTITVLCVAYIYVQASAMKASEGGKKVIFVPPPAQPFADPNAKKKYTETTYGQHMMSQAKAMLMSTLFGIALTVGLHLYKGIIVGISMQIIMGPLGFIENPLAKLFLMGGTKVFGEKTSEELTPEDEIVDAEGNTVTRGKALTGKAKPSNAGPIKTAGDKKSFEDVLLDTWDLGSEADIGPLMKVMNKSNVNIKTEENDWTPIMIVSGLGAKKTADALKKMKIIGADPSQVDGEGWNALHWAAFHGSVEAAKVLVSDSESGYDGIKLGLHTIKDKEGKTPLDHAEAEGNLDVAKVISDATATLDKSSTVETDKDEGLRKRK